MECVKSGIIQLFGAVSSQQGGRSENQDDYCFADTPLGFLAIVCDGMGGGPGGKTASYIVKTEMTAALCECTPQTPREQAFRMAAARANQALEEKMQQVPQLVGMGSTFVAVLINQQSAIVAHAGDSRFYRLHGKKCLYRTNDHSLVGELVSRKALTEEQARVSPQSNVITRGLGSTTNHVPDIQEIPYRKGDRFVMCTDGVWGIMPHENLLNRLTAPTDITSLVQTLSAEVDQLGNSQGGQHDNHTLVVIELGADSALKTRRIKWPLFAGGALAIVLLIVIGVSAARFISDTINHLSTSRRNYNGSPIASTQTSGNTHTIGTDTPAGPTTSSSPSNQSGDSDAIKQIAPTLRKVGEKKIDNTVTKAEDSKIKATDTVPHTPKTLTQSIIDTLEKAGELTERDSTRMAKKLESYKKTVFTNLDSLQKHYDLKSHAGERLKRLNDSLRVSQLWHYDIPDQEGYHHVCQPRRMKALASQMKLFQLYYAKE